MGNIASAELSPRIKVGVITWYEGDVFDIDLKVDLEDQDGEPIEIHPDDTLMVKIYNMKGDLVHDYFFYGDEFVNGVFNMEVTEEITEKFPNGRYVYDIILTHRGGITTLAKRNPLLVE